MSTSLAGLDSQNALWGPGDTFADPATGVRIDFGDITHRNAADPANSPYTAGVDRPPSAGANTQWKVPPTSSGRSFSPRPVPSAAPPTRLNGTSLPNSAQMSRSSSREALVPQSASQATSAPAPSAEPPAMPPATGMSLAIWMCTAGARP